jgi:DEAD/DEAH box helicase domain-containing protein
VNAIDAVLADPSFVRNIVCNRLLPARAASFVPFPADLDGRIKAALQAKGINAIYSHQAEVWDNVRAGRNTVVVTPTASGKTLCYNLPVLQELLTNPDSRALYFFPTKALSQDQQAELNEELLEPCGWFAASQLPPVIMPSVAAAQRNKGECETA